MGPDDIMGAASAQSRWQQLEEYRSEAIDKRLKKSLEMAYKKLDGAFVITEKIPDGTHVPANVLINNISHDMIYALSGSKEVNEQYSKLILKVISRMRYDFNPTEKHLAFIDIRIFSELFIGNNITYANTGDSAANADGLLYFWDLFAEPDDRGWTSSAKFCSFYGQIAHTAKGGRASDKGFLETFNILALRHSKGEDNFLSLDPDLMIASVNW